MPQRFPLSRCGAVTVAVVTPRCDGCHRDTCALGSNPVDYLWQRKTRCTASHLSLNLHASTCVTKAVAAEVVAAAVVAVAVVAVVVVAVALVV